MTDELEDLKKRLRGKPKSVVDWTKALSSGCTLINLACTGKPDVAFSPGHLVHLVGDSQSGKSISAHAALAEASINPCFDGYRLIYDNPEDGSLFDIEAMFGARVAGRLEPPAGSQKKPRHSSTVEQFYAHLDDALGGEKPCIYVIDSMDGLTCQADDELFAENKKKHLEGESAKESYGTGKSKINSNNIPRVSVRLRETNSILFFISQTRANIGFGAQFNPKVYSGGKAIQYHATLQLWFAIKGRIKKRVSGKDRQVGITAEVRVKKNRHTGAEPIVEVPIYRSHGLDDVGSMIDYMVEEGKWKGTEKKLTAPDFGFDGKVEDFIARMAEVDEENKLRARVARVWQEIEEGCKVTRRSRYI